LWPGNPRAKPLKRPRVFVATPVVFYFGRANNELSKNISHFRGAGGIMKLVGEYLQDSRKFEQMAEDATDEALKAAFMKQATDYRKLALKRAKQLGMPLPDVSPETSGNQKNSANDS
jgi:hypothetical protein